MAMMSDVDLPIDHVRAQVASAIDVIVHTARLPGGRRTVIEIAAVDEPVDGAHRTTTVFAFRPREGRAGRFVCTGSIPALRDRLRERGEVLAAPLLAEGEDRA
jgi:pilus assembly protein CpaF